MALRFPRLRPVDPTVFDQLTEAAQHLVVGVGLLAEMLDESSDKADVAARMQAAEQDADETSHAIVRRVSSSFVTPFDREDLYALASGLDDVMDDMEEVVALILVSRAKVLPSELSQQVEVLQRCAELTEAAMPSLRSVTDLQDYWIEINRLENAGNRSHRLTLARLFSGEFKTLEVLKLKDIAAGLESAVDAFERVASIVEQIAVKES